MFQGSMVALVTPLKDDRVDEEQLRELVEFHIKAGTHAIVAAGTTGEAGTLSLDEKIHVIKTVVEQAKERIYVIAGTGMNATKDCAHLTKEAMQCGACAVLVMTPAYIKPTQEGLYQHYSHVATEAAIPIILYNVPSRTGCDLQPETVARLAKHSNIIGIKEANSQLERLRLIQSACGEAFEIYSGDDCSAGSWLLEGAKGVISVTANVAPRLMAKLCDTARDGQKNEFDELNKQLMPLHRQLFVESNPIPVKWALSKMGFIANELRLPLTPLSLKHHEPLKQVLKSLHLL